MTGAGGPSGPGPSGAVVGAQANSTTSAGSSGTLTSPSVRRCFKRSSRSQRTIGPSRSPNFSRMNRIASGPSPDKSTVASWIAISDVAVAGANRPPRADFECDTRRVDGDRRRLGYGTRPGQPALAVDLDRLELLAAALSGRVPAGLRPDVAGVAAAHPHPARVPGIAALHSAEAEAAGQALQPARARPPAPPGAHRPCSHAAIEPAAVFHAAIVATRRRGRAAGRHDPPRRPPPVRVGGACPNRRMNIRVWAARRDAMLGRAPAQPGPARHRPRPVEDGPCHRGGSGHAQPRRPTGGCVPTRPVGRLSILRLASYTRSSCVVASIAVGAASRPHTVELSLSTPEVGEIAVLALLALAGALGLSLGTQLFPVWVLNPNRAPSVVEKSRRLPAIVRSLITLLPLMVVAYFLASTRRFSDGATNPRACPGRCRRSPGSVGAAERTSS